MSYTGSKDDKEGGESSVKTKEELHKMVTENIHDFLNVYYRFRLYVQKSGELSLSIRGEDINVFVEGLYKFRLIPPKKEHLENTEIVMENAPYYREFLPELKSLIHDYDLKKNLVQSTENYEDFTKFNYVAASTNAMIKRILLDHAKQRDRDHFIKEQIYNLISSACNCNADCLWQSYENLMHITELVDDLKGRDEQTREKAFGPLYVMSKDEMEKRLKKNTKRTFLSSMRRDIAAYDYEDSDEPILVNENTDNVPIPSIDVAKGRGLWASHSRTYPDWPSDAKKETSEEGPSKKSKTFSTSNKKEQNANEVVVEIVEVSVDKNAVKKATITRVDSKTSDKTQDGMQSKNNKKGNG
ncbi:hypothetical protein GCK72_023493 [Caenorhabditis remanei]|uniref:Uncharacterized protein n=1 Tax=Caenorhabditis remanei TaxID=31234 RepID=E3MMD7_CAERE|nr:hypothetical protein GCK72_023493 [Caenorhabditis remanei]EFP05058.1 hypothetical protein CRE_03275 [Caenorhabditis remanei]KAF1747035.1 hypothetical protein GCK72_023493 [Caenorhabditis remanei]